MKRLLPISYHTRSKKPRIDDIVSIQPIMVSATHIHNYMINDTLVDWLKLRTTPVKRRVSSSTQTLSFDKFIKEKGLDFENKVVEYIKNKELPITTISNYITDEDCKKTTAAMKAGIPIIHSAPVKNMYNNTNGIIDLLVRSDYLKNLADVPPLDAITENISAPRLSGKYHYVVVDIKFSTLPLRSDGIHLCNSGHYPAYKAQTLIYTQAIGRIQGYTAPYAFILGRRWYYTKKDIIYRNYTCFNRLGKIDFNGVDKMYGETTKNAIKWVRNVKEHGLEWSINPPSRPELYPNMCVDSGRWNNEKQKIADSIGEITNIWNVGVKNRQKALLNDIVSWKDDRCTAENIGINGVKSEIIDKILAINRQEVDKIWPKRIKNNVDGWKNQGNEVFVDFETLADIFSSFENLPNQDSSDMIFMIGVGWQEGGEWKYKNFISKKTTYNDEYLIMNEFIEFIKERGNPTINYWCAETCFWNIAECRQFDIADQIGDYERKDIISDNWKNLKWRDMYNIFMEEPIVIKGSFKFGLKSIAKAMQKHGMISTVMDSKCSSGMTAMVSAYECYNTEDEPSTCDVMKDIVKYNEYDCKVLWEIIRYLRNNHC
jgi:hypothetical protein